MNEETTKNTKQSLVRIFDTQNKVIQKYIQDYPVLYDFISKCQDYSNVELSPSEWDTIPEDRRTIFNYYQADILSTLINATRLCLQGCETDAYALLRVVNQELGEFNSVIEQSLYDQLYKEMQDNSMKGKHFSDLFRKKINKIKDKKREHVYGKLSNIGSHPSPTRVALSIRSDMSGIRVKVGMILNNPNVETCLLRISEHYLYAIRVFDEYFSKNLSTTFKSQLSADRDIAEAEFQKIMNAYKAGKDES
jgi:hypothetical protein